MRSKISIGQQEVRESYLRYVLIFYMINEIFCVLVVKVLIYTFFIEGCNTTIRKFNKLAQSSLRVGAKGVDCERIAKKMGFDSGLTLSFIMLKKGKWSDTLKNLVM